MAPKVAIVKKDGIAPVTKNYKESDVKIIQGMLEECLGLLGGIEKFVKRGSTVVIKPNCVFLEPPEVACNTDPRVIEALINIINTTNPKKVIISEWMRAAGPALFEVTGMNKAAKNTGAKVRASENDKLIHKAIPDAIGLLSSKGVPLFKAAIPETYVEADVLINVPKMKTHLTTVATLSLKNMLGIPPCVGPDSYLDYHNDNIHQAIVEYYKLLQPALNIIDGIVAMEGQAPYLSLEVVRDMNVIVAGSDGVAVDAVASECMGIHPFEVPTTRIASNQGLGEADIKKIEILGRKIEDVRRHFKRAFPDVIGYKRHDGLSYPFVVYTGGTCVGGRYCMTREACDMLVLATDKYKIPPEKQRKLYIILGMQTLFPKDLVKRAKREKAMVYVIGDCAAEHKGIAEEMGKSGSFTGVAAAIGHLYTGRSVLTALAGLRLRKMKELSAGGMPGSVIG